MGYGRGGVRITGGEVILNGRDILEQGKNGIRKLRGHDACYVAQSAAAAFNPSQRLMDQVVESSLKHGLANRAEAAGRWHCSASSAFPTRKISASAIRTSSPADNCNA